MVLRPAIVLLALLTVLTGLVYPLAATGLARVVFPAQANGSLIRGGAGSPVLGSALIGQPFSDPRYFWGRPSATTPFPYNAAASSGSNLGPSNPALIAAVQARIAALRAADPGNSQPVPVDLVTASASGLDPDISIAAALYQAPRVARLRGLDVGAMRQLVVQHAEDRQFGILGEPRVNVLKLNLALDGVEWTMDDRR
jgi:K+-transporting ATPase ATPase C chain